MPGDQVVGIMEGRTVRLQVIKHYPAVGGTRVAAFELVPGVVGYEPCRLLGRSQVISDDDIIIEEVVIL
jgi:hypothetical protein